MAAFRYFVFAKPSYILNLVSRANIFVLEQNISRASVIGS